MWRSFDYEIHFSIDWLNHYDTLRHIVWILIIIQQNGLIPMEQDRIIIIIDKLHQAD